MIASDQQITETGHPFRLFIRLMRISWRFETPRFFYLMWLFSAPSLLTRYRLCSCISLFMHTSATWPPTPALPSSSLNTQRACLLENEYVKRECGGLEKEELYKNVSTIFLATWCKLPLPPHLLPSASSQRAPSEASLLLVALAWLVGGTLAWWPRPGLMPGNSRFKCFSFDFFSIRVSFCRSRNEIASRLFCELRLAYDAPLIAIMEERQCQIQIYSISAHWKRWNDNGKVYLNKCREIWIEKCWYFIGDIICTMINYVKLFTDIEVNNTDML